MISGEASMTARHVAAYRQRFPRLDRPYGRPQDDLVLQGDVAGALEPDDTPMARYLRARTAFFDRSVATAIDDGVSQIVAVGAGYDGRSLRYTKPGTQWFELDHPDTQADKLERLERLALAVGHVKFVAADFTSDDVAASLAEAGHDSGQPTFFCCEGVAGYLPLDVLTALLAALRQTAAPGSTLAISVSLSSTDTDSSTHAALADAVAELGEPLASTLARAGVHGYFSGTGWAIERVVDPAGDPIESSTRSGAFVTARAIAES